MIYNISVMNIILSSCRYDTLSHVWEVVEIIMFNVNYDTQIARLEQSVSEIIDFVYNPLLLSHTSNDTINTLDFHEKTKNIHIRLGPIKK